MLSINNSLLLYFQLLLFNTKEIPQVSITIALFFVIFIKRFRFNAKELFKFKYSSTAFYTALISFIIACNYSSEYINIQAKSIFQNYYPVILISLAILFSKLRNDRLIKNNLADADWKYLFFLIIILNIFAAFRQAYFGFNIYELKIFELASVKNNYAGDKIRSMGFFTHANLLGIFLALSGAVIFSTLSFEHNIRKKIIWFILLFLISIAIYITYVRTSYILFSLSIISVFIIKKSDEKEKSKLQLLLIPVFYFAIGLLIYIYPFISDSFDKSNEDLTSGASIVDRLLGLMYFGGLFLDEGVIRKLFGVGFEYYKISNSDIDMSVDGLYLDNTYMSILIHIGIIGFISLFYLAFGIWNKLINIIDRKNPHQVGFAAFISTFPVASLFNVCIVEYGLILIFFLLTASNFKIDVKNIRKKIH